MVSIIHFNVKPLLGTTGLNLIISYCLQKYHFSDSLSLWPFRKIIPVIIREISTPESQIILYHKDKPIQLYPMIQMIFVLVWICHNTLFCGFLSWNVLAVVDLLDCMCSMKYDGWPVVTGIS